MYDACARRDAGEDTVTEDRMASTSRTEVAIVGAGPAGLAAAAEASRAGAHVTVMDEYAAPGGQFMRARRAGQQTPPEAASQKPGRMRERLLRELDATRVDILTGCSVWGAFAGRQLGLWSAGAASMLQYERLIVAAGAYERPIAFPGWTLPGVYTLGGVQTLVKANGVLPGARVLLAGSGPFLLPVAQELLAARAGVAGVLEASRPAQWRRQALLALGHSERIAEAVQYWRALRRGGVTVRFGCGVAAVRGDGRVEEAVITHFDDQWRPVAGSERTLQVDAVAIGYGFVPATELTRLMAILFR